LRLALAFKEIAENSHELSMAVKVVKAQV